MLSLNRTFSQTVAAAFQPSNQSELALANLESILRHNRQNVADRARRDTLSAALSQYRRATSYNDHIGEK